MWDPYAEFETTTLPNGLEVHAAHWPGRPWEAVGFLIHTGAEKDPVGLEGTAHFVEHLVSENCDMSKKDIEAFFGDYGGAFNLGRTNFDATYYNFFVPLQKEVLTKSFSIFGKMLLDEKFDYQIERIRKIIVEEFHHHFATRNEYDLCLRERRSLYKGHWQERFVRPLGNLDSIERIKHKDLQSFYDSNYTPKNLNIVGVGGLTLIELEKILLKSPFAVFKIGERNPIPKLTKKTTLPSESRHLFEFTQLYTTSNPVEGEISIGSYRSVAKILGVSNRWMVFLMNQMLDEILNDEIREKKAWTYDICGEWHNFRNMYQFSIGCNSLALRAIPTIEKTVEFCIIKAGKSKDLFEKFKKQTLAELQMIDFTGRKLRDGAMSHLSLWQKIIPISNWKEEIESVTMKDIKNLLKWLRPERRWTIIRKP